MYTVIVYFNNGEIELDKTFNSWKEAEQRAGNASHYYKMFGAIAMVLNTEMAKKLAGLTAPPHHCRAHKSKSKNEKELPKNVTVLQSDLCGYHLQAVFC